MPQKGKAFNFNFKKLADGALSVGLPALMAAGKAGMEARQARKK